MNFQKKVDEIITKKHSCVCVGLDSDISKLPKHLLKKAEPIFAFNQAIVEATYDLVCAYKPNLAFYEAEGPKGMEVLRKTVIYIKKKDPSILIIADAKRADIDNTNLGYVKAIFDYFKFDALTVHPYLGEEALRPFLTRKDKGVIVLCRTSNPGAAEFQDLIVNDQEFGRLPLYKIVAHRVVKYWDKNKNCALVVGATYPKELAAVRKIAGQMPLLIPGIGAQGGEVAITVKAGKDSNGRGMIINASRSIIFASSAKDFAQQAREKTQALKNLINKYC